MHVSARAMVAACAIAIAVVSVDAANAATVVTGITGGAQTPLVISPDSDPLVHTISGYAASDIAFVGKMPREMTIDRVTIGDFAAGPTCGAAVTMKAYLRENEDGDLYGASRQVAYSDDVPITSSLAPVSFSFPRTTLLEGQAYSFRVTSICNDLKHRTWAHNAAQVNGGTVRCTRIPGVHRQRTRMWHQTGLNDRDPACVNLGYLSPPYNGFHESMPTGWLGAATYNGSDWYVRASTRPRNPECAGDAKFLDFGGFDQFWRASPPENEGATDHTCTWSQFAPLGQEVPDGWYYGALWPAERDGAPRDVALRLDPAVESPVEVPDCRKALFTTCVALLDAAGFTNHVRVEAAEHRIDFSRPADSVVETSPPQGTQVLKGTRIDIHTNPEEPRFGMFLARRYRPALFFDTRGAFRPVDLASFFSETDESGAPAHSVCGPEVVGTCQPVASADALASFPASSHLNVRGGGEGSDYRTSHDDCALNDTQDCDAGPRSALYYHLAQAGGYRFIDYWAYYRFNDSTRVAEAAIGGLKHESDWENVTVGVPADAPTTFHFASFSAHGGNYSYLRENLSCDGGEKGSCGSKETPSGVRLSVYVADMSHANYSQPCARLTLVAIYPAFECGQPMPDGYRPEAGGFDGERPWGNNDVDPGTVLREFPTGSWVDWSARWGSSDTAREGPESPGRQPHFGAPFESTCARDNPDCPTYREENAAMARSASPDRGPATCDDWSGPFVALLVCDRERLLGAIDAGLLGAASTFDVTRSGATRSAPGAPGIAQDTGAPLRVGDVVTIRSGVDAVPSLTLRVARPNLATVEIRTTVRVAEDTTSRFVVTDVGGVGLRRL